MKLMQKFILFSLVLSMTTQWTFAQTQSVTPVSTHSSRESKALLQLIYNLSGKYTLTGQHNFPKSGDSFSVAAAQYIGKTPVIWSTDFGFAKDGDKDAYHSRPAIVQEAIRQYKKGSIITICWHAAPPTADEPVTFQPLPGADPAQLKSVQGRLTAQ